MMRIGFDEQLKILNNEMIKTGALCETAIALAVKSLEYNNKSDYIRIRELGDEISHKERLIESLCMKLLLQQQPVAADLRTVSSAMKMITDMERIGRQSADIADILNKSGAIYFTDEQKYIRQMATAVIMMVTDSITAFVNKDIVMAENVIGIDDEVDNCFDIIKANLTNQLAQGTENVENILNILLIAKYFERIADHAENIANWVIFSVTGQHKGD